LAPVLLVLSNHVCGAQLQVPRIFDMSTNTVVPSAADEEKNWDSIGLCPARLSFPRQSLTLFSLRSESPV
jgi:hypothetical protein